MRINSAVVAISLTFFGLACSAAHAAPKSPPVGAKEPIKAGEYCVDGKITGLVHAGSEYSKFSCCCLRMKNIYTSAFASVNPTQNPPAPDTYDSSESNLVGVRCTYHICREDESSAREAKDAFINNFMNCYKNAPDCV